MGSRGWEAVGSLVGATLASPVGAVIGLIRSAAALRHLPRAAANTVRVTWKTPRLGPNLRAVCLLTMPVGIVATPFLTLAAGTFYGVGVTFVKTFEETGDPRKGLSRAWKDLSGLDQSFAHDVMPKFNQYLPPNLEQDERVYEIPLAASAKALVVGLVGTALEAPLQVALVALHLPRIFWRGLRFIWLSKDSRKELSFFSLEGIVLRVTGTLALGFSAALVVTLIGPVSILASLGVGVYRTYKRGLRRALRGFVNDLRLSHKSLWYAGTTWHDSRDEEERDREFKQLAGLAEAFAADFVELQKDHKAPMDPDAAPPAIE